MRSNDYVNVCGTMAQDISVTEFLADCEELMNMTTRTGCFRNFTDMSSEEFETLKTVFRCYKDFGELMETWAANVNDIKDRQVRIEESLRRIESKLDK